VQSDSETTWIVACAWCGRIRSGDRWLVRADDEPARPASITHTICPECFGRTAVSHNNVGSAAAAQEPA
jgi:hypothetical protein